MIFINAIVYPTYVTLIGRLFAFVSHYFVYFVLIVLNTYVLIGALDSVLISASLYLHSGVTGIDYGDMICCFFVSDFSCVLACISIKFSKQVWYIKPTSLSHRRKKETILLLLIVSMVGLTWLWVFGPQSTYITHITIIGACCSVVVLWYAYSYCIASFNAVNDNMHFSWSDVIIRSNFTIASTCLVVYWVLKHHLISISDACSFMLLSCTCEPICTYVCGIDWLIVLPRTILYLCTVNIVCVMCVLYVTKDHNKKYHRRTIVILVHMIASFALMLGLMLGPIGCIYMVLCLVHTVVFVYCFVHVATITGIEVNSDMTLNACSGESAFVNKDSVRVSYMSVQTRLCTYVMYSAYFPLMGRFLYFFTGHRMDFGTLQV